MLSVAVNRQRDNAYSCFTERLLAKDIVPGQIVSQLELMDLTGMPLGAIREMVPRLEADGLIRTVPKRGLQVLTIDLELVRNAFQLRQIIESEAIAVFCARAPSAEIARIAEEHRTTRARAARLSAHPSHPSGPFGAFGGGDTPLRLLAQRTASLAAAAVAGAPGALTALRPVPRRRDGH